MTPDEAEQLRRDRLGIECEAKLSLTGSYQATQAQPGEVHGCWPVGTWTFTASVEDNSCEQAPDLLDQYSFSVVAPDPADVFAYEYGFATQPEWENLSMKVTEGGGTGLCNGQFEVWSADGKSVANLHPALRDGVITGGGEFVVYNKSQLE
jgi:hypothetical protein